MNTAPALLPAHRNSPSSLTSNLLRAFSLQSGTRMVRTICAERRENKSPRRKWELWREQEEEELYLAVHCLPDHNFALDVLRNVVPTHSAHAICCCCPV